MFENTAPDNICIMITASENQVTQHASFTGAVAVTFNQTMFDFSAVFPAVSFKSGFVCHS